MYMSNLDKYGHLLNADNYNTDHLNNDMYMIFDNRLVSVRVCGGDVNVDACASKLVVSVSGWV